MTEEKETKEDGPSAGPKLLSVRQLTDGEERGCCIIKLHSDG